MKKKQWILKKNLDYQKIMYFTQLNIGLTKPQLIIDSIKFLNDKKKLDFYAIFSGHDKGNLKYLKDYCNRINISKNVIFMNFLEEDDIGYFYKMSSSLVMPSCFWSHKHYPLEAFFLGVPSIYLNNHFNRQEFGGLTLL